ncbi:MAG: cell wall-binding repeat-containing protein [Lachnospiraceae bacterium]|nr:cell wall-binding repeat-containing protein [Lachnospiraceae bacterium]
MKKRLLRRLSLMLSLVLLLSLIPAVPAQALTQKVLKLNGIDVLANPEGTGSGGGTYSYNAKTNTLRLMEYSGSGFDSEYKAAFVSNFPLTLVLEGASYLDSEKSGLFIDDDLDVYSTGISPLGTLSVNSLDGIIIQPGSKVTMHLGGMALMTPDGTPYDPVTSYSVLIKQNALLNMDGGFLYTCRGLKNEGTYIQSAGEVIMSLYDPKASRGYYSNGGKATINGGNFYSCGDMLFNSKTEFAINGGNVTAAATGGQSALAGYYESISYSSDKHTLKAGNTESTLAEVNKYNGESCVSYESRKNIIKVFFKNLDSQGLLLKEFERGHFLELSELADSTDMTIRHLTNMESGGRFTYYNTPLTDGLGLECHGYYAERLAGDNRYATCAAIVNKAFEGETPREAVMVTGLKFPDALAASGFAGALDIPVLMSKLSSLPDPIIKLLDEGCCRRLERVYLIGNEFSDNVKSQLASRGIEVVAIGGADRYATANEIYKAGKNMGLFNTAYCFVATGKKAADALSASTWAYRLGAPMFLVNGKGQLNDAARKAIREGGFSRVYVLGSEGVNNDPIYREAQESGLFEVIRLGGADRYQTSAIINYTFMRGDNPDTQYLLSGIKNTDIDTYTAFAAGRDQNFPDALAGGQLARISAKTPMMLVSANAANNGYALGYVSNDGLNCGGIRVYPLNLMGDIDSFVFLGGEPAVSAETEAGILNAAFLYTKGGGVG